MKTLLVLSIATILTVIVHHQRLPMCDTLDLGWVKGGCR